MKTGTARSLGRAARIVSGAALVASSPLAAAGLLAANAYLKHGMARELTGRSRTAALLAANAVMCVAAGAVSTVLAGLPAALLAAGVLTWMFSGEGRGDGPPEDSGKDEAPPRPPAGLLPPYTGEKLPPV